MSMRRKLRKAYASATPDVWDRISIACAGMEQNFYAVEPVRVPKKGLLPFWLKETLEYAALIAALIGVIVGGTWLLNHYDSGHEDPPFFTNVPTDTTQPMETTQPTETTLPVETTVPPQTSEPTETTTPPETSEPPETRPEDTIPPQSTIINNYSHGLWQSAVYVEGRYENEGWDLEGCVESYLYCFDMKTGERTLICDEQVKPGLSCQTPDYIFYVTEANPRQMICSLPDGSKQFVCYEAQYADIVDITSVAPIGTLGILEGDQYLIQYNFESDTSQLLMEYEYIGSFYLGILDHAKVVEFKDAEGRYWVYYLDTKEIEESW